MFMTRDMSYGIQGNMCLLYPSKDKKWSETETYTNLGFNVGGEYLGANLAETTTVCCSLHIM